MIQLVLQKGASTLKKMATAAKPKFEAVKEVKIQMEKRTIGEIADESKNTSELER